MVQTRSKYRLLQNNSASVVSKEPTQQTVKRKRKRNNDNNDDDAQIITDSCMTTTSSLTLSTIDPVVIESMVVSSTSTLSHEAVDDAPDSGGDDNKYLDTSYLVDNPSDSEEENFDNNLYLEQQILIDALNREESEQETLQSDNTNPGAAVVTTTFLQQPDSWPIERDTLQWTKTRKSNDCLIIGNFSYIYMSKSQKKNVLNFRCQQRDVKCGAVVHLSLDTRTFIDTNNVNHNHPPDRFGMKQKLLNQIIDDRLAAEPTAVLKVIERVYAEANLTDEEQLNIRLPRTAVGTFYKKRSRRYPAHPKIQDFDIPAFYSTNNRGENFVIYDGNKERFGGRLLIFSTPKLLSALFNSDIILCDGTFKTRPLLFQQVYVLMGRYHGEIIPLVWCLTSSKAQSLYDVIWKKLQKVAKHMLIEWKMTECMMDFERAMINSCQEAFPNINVKCCWYHFVQSLWRTIQKIGLTTPYEMDPLVNTWFKQFMALPLISKDLINDGLQLLKDTIPSNDKYLKSASLMVGKVVGQSINAKNVDQTTTNGYLLEGEDEND
ncbi:unnamed protein product [Rotaria sordida]|uniref:MULE transposase domain-containing protein n=1 Tax=Rotaria sordida TaxID=392033 RepID=A0A819S1E0_9BILA|nr:unnamed protein product [Rotaria sordida]CAF4045931.1 unnamed protein product [Rotaria sordida]